MIDFSVTILSDARAVGDSVEGVYQYSIPCLCRNHGNNYPLAPLVTREGVNIQLS
jgi:hypothetical protein